MKGYKKSSECTHEITHFFHVLSMKFKYCRKCTKILKGEGYSARGFLTKDGDYVLEKENA